MDCPAFDLTLDDLLVRALARHYSDCDEAHTLQDALACLALACWTHAAATPDPYLEEQAARAAVLKAVDFAARSQLRFRAARRLFKAFLKTDRRLLRRPANPLTARLQRTYWLMATRLFETGVEVPGCPDLIFPYLHTATDDRGRVSHQSNVEKAADAIVCGIRRLREHQPSLIPHLPTKDAVRQALKRHVAKSDAVYRDFHQNH